MDKYFFGNLPIGFSILLFLFVDEMFAKIPNLIRGGHISYSRHGGIIYAPNQGCRQQKVH